MSRPRDEGCLTLADGRILAYADWGHADASPVFGFHGTPNSRLTHLGGEAPAASDTRLVLPDRPGLGRSEMQPGRKLLDWPQDVAELADALDIERFAVFGVSGGGPHALACGYALPERVTTVGLVASAGPAADVPAVGTRISPEWRDLKDLLARDRLAAEVRLLKDCAGELARARVDPDGWLDDWAIDAPPADRAILSDPAIRRMYIESCREATVQGYVRDFCLLLDRWGFDPSSLRVPVLLWHGELDPTVPVDAARELARRIPGCIASFFPDEGHLLVHAHATEILAALAASLSE